MNIDYGLILAAGYGTRMGSIGTKLPKVLWPVFEKRIIDLQIAFFKKIGVKKIFINLHFKADEIEASLKNKYQDITFLKESTLLDVGGAVLNLKKYVNSDGILLLNSGDQFIFPSSDDFYSSLKIGERSSLMTVKFRKEDGYNGFLIEGDYLKKVIPNQELDSGKDYFTYCGMSLINLGAISNKVEKMNFFKLLDSDSKKNRVFKIKQYDYFDFGTPQRYVENMFRLMTLFSTNEKSNSLSFFSKEAILDIKKLNIKNNSYGKVVGPDSINLGSYKINNLSNGQVICLNSMSEKNLLVPGIYSDDDFVELK